MNRIGAWILALAISSGLLVAQSTKETAKPASKSTSTPPSAADPQAGPQQGGLLDELEKQAAKQDDRELDAKNAKQDEEDAKKAKKKLKDHQNPDKIGDRNVGKGIDFYSIEKEIALGKAYAQELERSAKIIDDPVIAEYVNRVGQNLVRNSDVKVPVTIKVLDDPIVNAMALPGGFFYVNSGLILRADTEAELAGVMSHEIAHIAARHGTKQMTRGQLANLATIPLIFMGGWAGYGIRQAAGIGLTLGFLKFSRGFEEEADMLGLQYMYKAGYDPTAFVDFFEKLQTQEKRRPGTVSKIFSTHPLTDSRIQTAQKNIGEILATKPEYVVTRSEFDDVKSRLQMLQAKRRGGPVEDPNKPTLKRAPGGNGGPIESGDKKDKTDDDERPTLKRRPTQ